MKRITALLLMAAYLTGSASYAAEDREEKDKKEKTSGKSVRPVRQAPAARQAPGAQTNRPARERERGAVQSNNMDNRRQGQRPSLGQNQGNQAVQQAPPANQAPVVRHPQAVRQPNRAQAPAAQPGNARNRQAAAQENVRRNLSRIGVKAEPKRILDRSKIVSTDRAHSTISYPRRGAKGEALRGSLVSQREINSRVVRDQMAFVNRPSYSRQIERERNNEIRINYIYWHEGSGFNYAHYIDRGGYSWYGWYRGDRYFWTRHYNDRWWWYDAGYDRWCFYQDNYWWWQDPYNEDELYYYDNDSYVSINFSVD